MAATKTALSAFIGHRFCCFLNLLNVLQELGYSILSTGGTGKHLKANGVDCEIVLKIQEGRPNIGDLVKNGDIAMMLITSTGDLSILYRWIMHDDLLIE